MELPGVKFGRRFTTEFVDANAARGFGEAATVVQVLKQCGEDLSRDNIMRQAANLKAFHPPMLFPGITIDTSPDNFRPIRRPQLASFRAGSRSARSRPAEPGGGGGRVAYCLRISIPSRCSTLTSRLRTLAPSRFALPASGARMSACTSLI